MNAHDVDALTPGRELDALISREVFDQCPHDTPKAVIDENDENQCTCFTCSKQICADCTLTLVDYTGDFDQGTVRYFDEQGWICPRYSTDLNAAFKVVEQLLTKGIGFDIQVHPNTDIKIYTYKYHWGYRPVVAEIQGQGLAELICKIALMTLLVLKEQER